MRGGSSAHAKVMEIGDRPDPLPDWVKSVWSHRQVLGILARKEFQTRYKRTSLGVVWAMSVPLLQAVVMAVVFSRVIKSGGGSEFPAYVMSAILPYIYFSTTITVAGTSIVDAAHLTDKVWFPRVILVLVPCITNLVGLVLTLGFLMAILAAVGGHYTLHLLLLPLAMALVVMFTAALSVVLASAHVYFRDVRYLVQASLTVLLYLTPIVYAPKLLGRFHDLVEFNPLTGIVGLFRLCFLGSAGPTALGLGVSLGSTVLLALAGAQIARTHDRLFVDLL